jgi:hypothetical protein
MKIRIFFVFLLFLVLPKSSISHSKEYYIGYVRSVADDLIPEEDVKLALQQNVLFITINGESLDLHVEQRLKERLRKTNFFKEIKVSCSNKIQAESVILSPLTIKEKPNLTEVMPAGAIYASPIADPKWPRFSVGYQKHQKDHHGKNIYSLSFGENLALFRYKTNSMMYELGIQAGLFGIMDISSDPTRLINSDYFVGLGLSFVKNKRWQNMIQFSHLSSHLGDELLVSNPKLTAKRINLSYETLKWLAAYKFNALRPYIGCGYIVHHDPSSIKPMIFEGGIDYLSEEKFLFQTTRAVAGINIHAWEENRFKPSFNVRAGLQLENPVWQGRFLQGLLDYSYGKSRHGQFYRQREHYVGVLIALSN